MYNSYKFKIGNCSLLFDESCLRERQSPFSVKNIMLMETYTILTITVEALRNLHVTFHKRNCMYIYFGIFMHEIQFANMPLPQEEFQQHTRWCTGTGFTCFTGDTSGIGFNFLLGVTSEKGVQFLTRWYLRSKVQYFIRWCPRNRVHQFTSWCPMSRVY